ncbi:MAG: hypothetical protein KAG28_06705 [Cocleimonas sp.]|nr:hypothetical protein [Cocleimonas sp.]
MKTYLSTPYTVRISAFIAFIALTACQDSAPTKLLLTHPVATLHNASTITSKGKRYTVEFSPNLSSIPLNQYFDLEVVVKGSTQQALNHDIDLEIDAGMKAHNHGMNVKPIVKRLDKGRFRIEGMLLHMSGDWFIRFTLRRSVMSDSAEVNLVVRP